MGNKIITLTQNNDIKIVRVQTDGCIFNANVFENKQNLIKANFNEDTHYFNKRMIIRNVNYIEVKCDKCKIYHKHNEKCL